MPGPPRRSALTGRVALHPAAGANNNNHHQKNADRALHVARLVDTLEQTAMRIGEYIVSQGARAPPDPGDLDPMAFKVRSALCRGRGVSEHGRLTTMIACSARTRGPFPTQVGLPSASPGGFVATFTSWMPTPPGL